MIHHGNESYCVWTRQTNRARGLTCDTSRQIFVPKGDQPWMFIGRTDAEAETPILWPPHAKSWLTGKDPDAGKDWRREEKGTTEDEVVGWHHWLDEHESEQALGVGDGQGSLACCSPWGHKESDTTERLNWTAKVQFHIGVQRSLEEGAVLCFVAVRWACHTSTSATEGKRNHEIAWNWWKKSQSNERSVRPTHAFCRTIIRVVKSVCQKCPIAFR